MKNSNRRFIKDEWNIFENLSQTQMKQLCLGEIIFTDVTGFLFISKHFSSCKKLIPRQQLYNSMKETLMLSQN
ncbi:hypothetical protein FRZ67_23165 [Panacibacter ginsenosidivorans]|uniref:Uncharacterized protein n=1 Tax=Panacibacter ginsenosidivorans TaxID=1813871 RepID=A0A5B8VF55_9BACT|nr:hypothetical protein [Panacibacter ginsenosidivorans]QEC70060.1 hypothetical protein FRZ67_23165 [Panacibacter ginsenosidivorans]